jgi:hypothetical protein
MTVNSDLRWDEPDAGCVTCGKEVLTVDDHRCGTCLSQELRHCPHCLGDIADIVNRDLMRRVRTGSWAMSEEWNRRKMLDFIDSRLRAAAERRKVYGR